VQSPPLYEQQYEPPSGQFASELNDWEELTLEMHQMSAPIYYLVMAPVAKGNPESYVYFEEGVGAFALPVLQPEEE
jgi:hypothetical protein